MASTWGPPCSKTWQGHLIRMHGQGRLVRMHEFARLSLPAVPPFLLDMPQLSVREMETIDEVIRVRKGTDQWREGEPSNPRSASPVSNIHANRALCLCEPLPEFM